jgi:hemolysin III
MKALKRDVVRPPPPIPLCRPFSEPYDRAELLADGLMQIAGIVLAFIGMALLTSITAKLPEFQSTSVWIYGIGLVLMFGISAAYNLWPVCSTKLVLRRFDHSMIYLFIAATYTPFIAQAEPNTFTKALLAFVWAVAGVGVILKLVFPGRLERLGILLCVAMGWSGLLAYDTIFSPLPASTVGWIVCGGLLYSGGVIFHCWDRLRFQNAVWHAFVIGAAVFQFVAVFNSVSAAASASG